MIGVVTPVKDEIDNLDALFKSVANQSIRPDIWVIVDDNSTDGSSERIQSFVSEHEWAVCVENTGSSEYELGLNYARVLNRGFKYLFEQYGEEIDYYLVLDGDMELTSGYIEVLLKKFEETDSLAVASGGIYYKDRNDELKFETRFRDHPAGGATCYKGAFYRSIGGPPLTPGTDGSANIKARKRGYDTLYLDEITEKAIQARPTGQKGTIVERFNIAMKRGSNYYRLNAHPTVIIMNSLKRTLQPEFYMGIGFFLGYLRDRYNNSSQISDEELKKYYYEEKPKEMVHDIKQNFKAAITLLGKR